MLLRSHALRSALRGAARIAPHRYGALRACSASADAGHQGGPTALYEAAVARNEISADEDQVAALRLLQRVHNDIAQALAEGNEPRADAAAVRSDGAAASSSSDGGSDGGGAGWFSSLFGAGKSKAGNGGKGASTWYASTAGTVSAGSSPTGRQARGAARSQKRSRSVTRWK